MSLTGGRTRPDRLRRPWLFLAAAAMAATPLPAQINPGTICVRGDAEDCRHLLAATAALANMLTSGDPAAVEAHFAADAQVTFSNGERTDRSGLVAAVRCGPRAARAQLDRAEARITGDVAVVTWAESWSRGARPAGRTVGTDIWQRRAEGWRVVASTEVRPSR